MAPRPEPGAPGVPLTTEALAAPGDDLEHLCRHVAISLTRWACPASSSTIVEEQDDLKRRMDEYMLHRDYHQSIRGENGEEPIEAIRSRPQTDMDSYYYSGLPTDLANTASLARRWRPGLRSLHHHAKSQRGNQNLSQQPERRKHIYPMVLSTERQNCLPNCYLDPEICT